jgi:23S rRNA (guanine745-N1)-methyltransferase
MPLVLEHTSFVCVNGHRFDRAREGYVNLLRGGRLKSRPPGDDDVMVRARRAVFDAGLYRPIIDAVARTVAAEGAANVLDAGCGEGSYLAAATALAGAAGAGIDISKAAVRVAARRHPHHRYAVASSYALPFEDQSFDTIVNVFSPRDFVEMFRVLRPHGRAIVVVPGPQHLHQLKEALYDTPRPHTGIDHDQAPESVTTVRFSISLADDAMRESLLQMTPYWWSATPERRHDALQTLRDADAEMDVCVYVAPA